MPYHERNLGASQFGPRRKWGSSVVRPNIKDPGIAVERATVLDGPALILTSVVLACGLAVTVFSDLPSLRLFGWLSAFAMIAALTADLCILRPTAMFLRRIDDCVRKGLIPSLIDYDR